jgi:endonuclease/exonuclease/phosphatase family metal-dependent hydrolase
MRLLTLNCEGIKHLDDWVPVVANLNVDVLCVQELFASSIPLLESRLGLRGTYVPTVVVDAPNRYLPDLEGEWGIGIFSRYPLQNIQIHQYGGPAKMQSFQVPNDDQRFFLSAEIEIDGTTFVVGTLHFTWSAEGEISQLQQADFHVLESQLATYSDLILCGDFNAPRGREMYAQFAARYNDLLPSQYTTTIDGDRHYAGPLELVVDTVFATHHYAARECRPISGLSDHKGIFAELEKLPHL